LILEDAGVVDADVAVAVGAGDPRITMEFYAHLAPGYLRHAIERLAINPGGPEELPQPAVVNAFAAPLLQGRDPRDFSAAGETKKPPVFGDLPGSGIPGSNRRHSAWENENGRFGP
jgi:hypothetical protein